ncbi:restriction endonuclease [Bhargavaea cecembensis]|uniref:restriction endonuclease n=1 Tax=Bhargavaea cecembensis TaxID=394098 RepID=UPI00058F0247|nr:restriction endonuclease [Bhargavaea cecembensis]
MARKKKDQFASAVVGLLFAGAGYTYLKTFSFETAAVVFFGGFVFVLLALFAVSLVRERKLNASGIRQVDEMSGKQFEDFLRLRYQARGYRVRQTPYRNDFGADLILERDGRRIVVQAKRWKKNVGIQAVQEIVAARQHYKADAAWVVTNSQYTKAAKELAGSNEVRLVDRTQLIHILLEKKAG